MQKFLFDKEIVNNQLSVLNNTLASQRQTKKTLLSHLEKFSDAMYENFNSKDTDSLLSLINEAHSIFECIKANISKTLELKAFLENIYNSSFLNTIDSEKFNNDFNFLLECISKTNSSYLTFMNNYENFIKPTPINENNNYQESSQPDEFNDIILESPIQDDFNDSSSNEIKNDIETEEKLEEVENEIEIKEELEEIEEVEEESLFETTNLSHTITNEIPVDESLSGNINDIVPNNITEKTSPEIELELELEPKTNINTETENEVEIESAVSIESSDIPEKIVTENIENTIEEISETNDFTITDEPSHSITLPEKELIIDKSLGIAILPYSISDLDEVFLDDPEKYSSIQDIIEQEYTVLLKDYENSSFTRYKEAFKLAKDKSNYSFSQAANFAKKFLVENEITSLIIASCNNVEELEFYIECLNNNNLQEFHYFKIVEK